LSVTVLVDGNVKDVAETARRLVVPDDAVMSPPTVKLLSDPTDVRELLVTPDPRLVDESTELPPT
jgi:hypothetical protein